MEKYTIGSVVYKPQFDSSRLSAEVESSMRWLVVYQCLLGNLQGKQPQPAQQLTVSSSQIERLYKYDQKQTRGIKKLYSAAKNSDKKLLSV